MRSLSIRLRALRRALSLQSLQLTATYAALSLIPLIQRVPPSLARPVGFAIGSVAFRCWRRYRNVALHNLLHAFPDYTEQQRHAIARSTFRNWGAFVLETIRLPMYTERDWSTRVIVEGREHVEKPLSEGRGVIIFTGHLGCFEIGAAFAAHEKVPTSVIVRHAKTREITERITRLREASGYKVLVYDARGFRAMRNLKAGQIVCLLIDQDAGDHGIFVDFFGRPASTPPGPAVLAGRTGAALIPGWVVMEKDGRYRMIVEPEVPNPGPRPTPESIHETTQEMTRRLEAVVRRFPDQWLWMHRRWKTQPGAP